MATDSSTTICVPELEKMVEDEQWERRSIYKLPPCVTSTNKTAYTPKMVSFGPYHYNGEHLKQMEWHKRRALNRFLKRSNLTYDDCFGSLLEIVGELMDAYDWLDPNQDTKMFLEIMIRDGAFMLEIICDEEKSALGYANKDPIFSRHGDINVIPHVKRDMLIIENQIPIKVVHKLYQLQFKEKDPNKWQEMDANKVVFQFFFPEKKISEMPPNNSLHVLDMYRTVMLGSNTPFDTGHEEFTFSIGGKNIIGTARELTLAGVKIRRSRSTSIRDISFQKGVLRLPRIVVDDATESLFLNLIAYERFHVGAGNEVTTYIFFMGNMIHSAQDIRLLDSKNIMDNAIGRDSAVAELFSSMSRDICLDHNIPLARVYGRVRYYCSRTIRRFRVVFFRTYFSSAWLIISVIGAALLFILTLTQTTYAIMDFYDNN